MTPGARVAAAADVLDRYLAGEAAEKVLTTWARRSRFAGSKDRAAVRDIVFDAIRRRRSAAWLGGGESGRGLVIGLLRAMGQDPAAMLTGEGHALAPLTEAERDLPGTAPDNVRLDCPDWLEEELRQSLEADFAPVMARMQTRAPLFLRVNVARGSVAEAQAVLAGEGVVAVPHPLCDTALDVREGARAVRGTRAYCDGLVEVQDVASQAVIAGVPLPANGRVLDYCAGGGGKALALAARGGGEVFAHDADPRRMTDLPERAERAGAAIRLVEGRALDGLAPFALAIADVPCSGSGAWRRQPEAKWRLRPEDLERLAATQRTILERLSRLVAPGGSLAYMTCSLLQRENEDQIAGFLGAAPDWHLERSRRISPLEGGDGFFLALLRRTGRG